MLELTRNVIYKDCISVFIIIYTFMNTGGGLPFVVLCKC